MTGLDALFDVELINNFAFDHKEGLWAIVEDGVLNAALYALPTASTSTSVTWGMPPTEPF